MKMKLLKTIKSTFEAIGMAVFIYFFYVYAERPEEFLVKEALIAFGVAVLLVWMQNRAFRIAAEHFELSECPYCGAQLDYAEDSGTWHDTIRQMDVDTMGEFLMEWGLACCKNEEPKDVFTWLESKAEEGD